MHSTTVSKNFDKESTAWRLFEGRMHFLKELDGTLGGDSFFFLSSFHQAFLSMYNRHQHVSLPVKVYVIQQLCLHFRSHMSVFQKMNNFYKEVFHVLFNGVVPYCCQMASVRSDSLPPSLSQGENVVHANLPTSQAPIRCLFAQMPLQPGDESEVVQGGYGGHRQQPCAQPVSEIDVSNGSYYHRLLTISYYAFCYSTNQSLRERTVFSVLQWLYREHTWLYVCYQLQFNEKVIRRDRLIHKHELGFSLQVLAGLYPTRDVTSEENRVTIGKRVLSNIMAYCTGYFGCVCLEDFEYCERATQVLEKISDWEDRNYQTAQANCYGYGDMFIVSKAHLHQNVHSYYNLTGLDFGDSSITHPYEWSSVRSFIVTAKNRLSQKEILSTDLQLLELISLSP
jgi:hypothetical protein